MMQPCTISDISDIRRVFAKVDLSLRVSPYQSECSCMPLDPGFVDLLSSGEGKLCNLECRLTESSPCLLIKSIRIATTLI